MPLEDETGQTLRGAFDRHGLLVFRDIEIDYAYQCYLSTFLIRRDGSERTTSSAEGLEDNFYISNRRPESAAPYGRLQFHADAMWSKIPVEVLSLYGVDVEQPSVPTTFVSTVTGWEFLPHQLKRRVEGLSALHTAGEVRRGDLTDVLLTVFPNAPTSVFPIRYRHPRTGVDLLYVCEQMTREVVGLESSESEKLLEELFSCLYQPAARWSHDWRKRDLVVWDNLAVQHGRANVDADGPARTLRKFFSPLPHLEPDQRPVYAAKAEDFPSEGN
jgi:alpha-ketoglutarate-dependent taurine dioxygenase